MSDYLVGDIVDRCLNVWLLGTYAGQFNRIVGAITATETELDCDLPIGELGRGAYLALEDELCTIVERDSTNNRLVVIRGVRGTLPTTHPTHTVIEVNPRFPRFMVRTAMAEEIDGWPETLYAIKDFTADVASSSGIIPVETDIDHFTVRHVVRVRRQSLNIFDDRRRPTDGWEFESDLEGGGTINLASEIGCATSFKVTVACAFNRGDILELGDECDLVDDVGLAPGMVEILELGACYRLLSARGAVRLFPEAQGQSREASEVGPRDIPQFALSLLGLRERAVARESGRLYSRYGFGG